MSTILTIGGTTIELHDGWSVCRLPGGRVVHARHDEQPGQAETAWRRGLTIGDMNRTHDLTHVLLCHWLGLPESIALTAGGVLGGLEEDAVLAIQAFAAHAGVRLADVAERFAERQP